MIVAGRHPPAGTLDIRVRMMLARGSRDLEIAPVS
jgi:hypothetical protein